MLSPNLLLTGDWQTRLSNIAQCEAAAERLIHVARKLQVDAVVVAGDLKHQYSPVDLRVIDFWRWLVRQYRFIVLLGNHDRVGLYSDETNWLGILADAGAAADTEPTIHKFNDRKGRLYTLPFMGSEERWKKANVMLDLFPSDPACDILAYHQTVTGARFNKLGSVVDPSKGIPLDTLRPTRFRFCIGGDIHLPQYVTDNVVYTGSPFTMDWGEVNQQKFFVLVNDEGLKWIPTGMPAWHDPGLKSFRAPKSYAGSRVRIRVPVSSGDYGPELELARSKATSDYPGASILVLPEMRSSETQRQGENSAPGDVSLADYVPRVLPEEIRDEAPALIAYLNYKLSIVGGGNRTGNGVRFTRIWAEKFLCYDRLELELGKPGVTLITGENRDWPGRSNGTGKSSLMMALPVALFGKTFKGQAFDGWTQEDSEGTSKVGVEFITDDGSVVEVERTRNPLTVTLKVNGVKRTAGSRSNDTTKDIEDLVGYSMDAFGSSAYISQSEVGAYLWGTPKQKQETLARLQNLERYTVAAKLIGKDLDRMNESYADCNLDLQVAVTQLNHIQSYDLSKTEIARLEEEMRTLRDQIATTVTIEPSAELIANVATLERATQAELARIAAIKNERDNLAHQLTHFDKLGQQCSNCGQKIPEKYLADNRTRLGQLLKKKTIELDRQRVKYKTIYDHFQKNRNEVDVIKQEGAREKERRRQLSSQWDSLWSQLNVWQVREKERRDKEQETLAEVQLITLLKEQYETADIPFYQAAKSIFARDGYPAFLSHALCPRLNEAAEYCSDLFAEGAIKVVFSVADGLPQAEVVNPNGSRKLIGQSEGEGRMAAIITAFSLRAADRSNILILDEPGDGLDPVNAAFFAQGINQMKGGWEGEIFLISHNSAILAELEATRHVKIVKEKKVSRIVQET